MTPFKSDLEYLADGIALIVAAAELCNKRSGKEEYTIFDSRKKNEASEQREAELKHKKAESKFKVRLQMTLKGGVFFPRLERLVKRLGLSHFERLIVLALSMYYNPYSTGEKLFFSQTY